MTILQCVAFGTKLQLTRAGQLALPGGLEQSNRFIQSYTKLQSETAPFDRFRFYPTDDDKARMQRLRAGETDTVRVLCLRVEFVEDTTSLTTGTGKMDTFGFLEPDSGLFYDPPHFRLYFERQMEGLRNYYLAQSLGRLYVDYTVMPEGERESYQLPRQMQFYGDTTSWQAVEVGLVRLMRDAFKIADEDAGIHFGDYDEFIVFHAGSGLQADFGLRRDSPFDLLAGEIPPGALEAYLGEPYIQVDSGRTRIEQATVLPEMMRQDTMYNDQTNILGMVGLSGTLCHEFAHLLGAYDLYDVTGITMGCGGWSLMGYGGWLGDYSAGAPPGVIPGFLDAYHRVHLGLIDTVSQVLRVRTPRESIPVFAAEMDTALFCVRGDTSSPTVLKVPITRDEYFLVENRQIDVRKPDTIVVDVEDGVLIAIEDNEYDFFQPQDTAHPRGGSGILIWHVDEAVIADYGPYNAINIDPQHKGVDLEEADGVQDFDVEYWLSWDPESEIYGNKFDPFFKGGYNDRFTAATNPPSDGYYGKTFLSIALLGEEDTLNRLKDTVIPVSIGWDLYQSGFPVDHGQTPFLSPFAADVDLDGSLEIAALDTAGQLGIWRSNGQRYRALGIGSSTRADLALGNVMGDEALEAVAAGDDGVIRVIPCAGGLPTELETGDRVVAAPVLADLNGDGRRDIIVGSTDMKLHAWTWSDSFMPAPGFPVDLRAEVRAPVAVTDTVRPHIVCLTGDGRLFLFDCNGDTASGFPVVLSNVAYYNTSQPLVGDFDRDGEKEIAVVAGGEFDNRVWFVALDGTVEHVSKEIVRQPCAGNPGAADMSGDGYPDVLLASMNDLFAFNHNATLVTNYPFRQDSTYETSELAGNWIIYYDVYFQYLSSPIAADLDGDGLTDVAIGSPRYGVLGFDGRTGRELPCFPLMTTGSISTVPLCCDLDRDGDLELAVGADDGILYVWDLSAPAGGIRWACAFHDPCHTGLLFDDELPVMPDPLDELVSSFFVYPNPAQESVTARYHLGPGESEVRLRLLDMNGELEGQDIVGVCFANADNETVVDLSAIQPGLYVVRLQVRQGDRSVVRFAKLAVVR